MLQRKCLLTYYDAVSLNLFPLFVIYRNVFNLQILKIYIIELIIYINCALYINCMVWLNKFKQNGIIKPLSIFSDLAIKNIKQFFLNLKKLLLLKKNEFKLFYYFPLYPFTCVQRKWPFGVCFIYMIYSRVYPLSVLTLCIFCSTSTLKRFRLFRLFNLFSFSLKYHDEKDIWASSSF